MVEHLTSKCRELLPSPAPPNNNKSKNNKTPPEICFGQIECVTLPLAILLTVSAFSEPENSWVNLDLQ
jgi:hypothetical protein